MFDIDAYEKLERLQTPFWYYDCEALRACVDSLAAAAAKHGISVHYALKANCERRIVSLMSRKGFGADCVSLNEVLLALECGMKPGEILYAGVGKTDRELAGALGEGVCFNCESLQEIRVLDILAGEMKKKADICVRINPDVDAHTAKFITSGLGTSKFGIPSHNIGSCIELLKKCRNINFKGLHFHLGSQITDVENVYGMLCEKANRTADMFDRAGLRVSEINLGGGLGVDYSDPDGNLIPDFERWLDILDKGVDRKGYRVVRIEPGRSLVAQSCTLVSRILFTKEGEKNDFIILDAGMNDLMRPALYGAYHKIENISASLFRSSFKENSRYDVVGPICESSDTWGKDRMMPQALRGDIVAIRSAGAYGSSMSSSYNMRDRAATVFSDEL